MEAGQYEGVICLALGTFTFLIANGTIKARTTAEGNAAFLRKYRKLFLFMTLYLLVRGGTFAAKLYW